MKHGNYQAIVQQTFKRKKITLLNSVIFFSFKVDNERYKGQGDQSPYG